MRTAPTRAPTPAATRPCSGPGRDDQRQRSGRASSSRSSLAVLRGYGLEGDDAIHAVRIIRAALHGFVTLETGGGLRDPARPRRQLRAAGRRRSTAACRARVTFGGMSSAYIEGRARRDVGHASPSRSRSRSASTAEPLAVTMRTPGHDEELALGFLYGEGLIDGPRDAGLTEDFAANTIEVAGPLTRDPGERRFYTTSSCGVCGKGALEEVAVHSAPLPDGPTVAAIARRRPAQPRSSSRPSSAPAACTPPACSRADGELLHTREDVGRHNAMDKVDRPRAARRTRAARRADPVRQRPAVVRARAEGRRRRRADPRRRSAPRAHWRSRWPRIAA